VEIYYTVYDSESANFFLNHYIREIEVRVVATTSEVDVIPNPNRLDCDVTGNETCWSYHAHVIPIIAN